MDAFSAPGWPVYAQDVLQTGPSGAAIIEYSNLALCSIWNSSNVQIWPMDDHLLDLIRGVRTSELYCDVSDGYVVWLDTPFGWVQVFGATVGISFDGLQMTATMYEGTAQLQTTSGQVQRLGPGDSFTVSAGGAQIQRTVHPPLTAQEQLRLAAIGGIVPPVLAPGQAAVFNGSVVGGPPASSGAIVEALVNGTVCGAAPISDVAAGPSFTPIGAVALLPAPASGAFHLEVNSALTQRSCARNGDTIAFQIRAGNTVEPLQPTATFQSGVTTTVTLTP
jgi:hypothetical protein